MSEKRKNAKFGWTDAQVVTAVKTGAEKGYDITQTAALLGPDCDPGKLYHRMRAIDARLVEFGKSLPKLARRQASKNDTKALADLLDAPVSEVAGPVA